MGVAGKDHEVLEDLSLGGGVLFDIGRVEIDARAPEQTKSLSFMCTRSECEHGHTYNKTLNEKTFTQNGILSYI